MDYFERLSKLDVQLVAVSKTKPNEDILALYEKGQRVFGENRVQEIVQKYNDLPKDIQWHFIGHLQSKKTKEIAPFVAMIHSIDSFKLLGVVDKEAAKNNRKIDVLLQIKIAQEDSKYGFEFQELMDDWHPEQYNNISFRGVMGMATFTDEEEVVRNEFKNLASFKKEIKKRHFQESDAFDQLSMGMSGDYEIAIQEGSTMIRIGSLLFGAR
jgi:pyridoxal phosphate enzyme (YggS family)